MNDSCLCICIRSLRFPEGMHAAVSKACSSSLVLNYMADILKAGKIAPPCWCCFSLRDHDLHLQPSGYADQRPDHAMGEILPARAERLCAWADHQQGVSGASRAVWT